MKKYIFGIYIKNFIDNVTVRWIIAIIMLFLYFDM